MRLAWALLLTIPALAGCIVTDVPAARPVCPVGGSCLPFQDAAADVGIKHVTVPRLERPAYVEAPPRAEPPPCFHERNASHPDCQALGVPVPFMPSHGAMDNASNMWSMTGGIAVADVDGDGCMDLHFADLGPDRLYLGDCQGHLRDESQRLGSAADGNTTMGLFLDYDNDGDPDLFLAQVREPSRLLRNDGGTFTDATAQAGVGRTAPSYAAAAADIDHDGWLDLVVGNYYRWYDEPSYPPGSPDEPEWLYLNQRDGTFKESAVAWGLRGDGPTLAVGFADYDGDGWDDLAVANDFGEPTSLWRNEAGTGFSRVNNQTGVASERDGMGIVWADLDGNAWQDLYVSNIFESLQMNPTRRGNVLMLNEGDGTFRDASVASGTYDALWSWGGVAFDAEMDGDLDLFVPNGYIDARFMPMMRPPGLPPGMGAPGMPGQAAVANVPPHLLAYVGTFQPNRFFENLGSGRFREAATAWGLADRVEGRGAVVLDLDGDGALDIVTTAVDRTPLVKLNRAPQGNSITLHLEGAAGNRDAVGTLVWATVAGRTTIAERHAGMGFLSQSAPDVRFGLAGETSAQLKVRWNGGALQQFDGVTPGAYRLVEGGTLERLTCAGCA